MRFGSFLLFSLNFNDFLRCKIIAGDAWLATPTACWLKLTLLNYWNLSIISGLAEASRKRLMTTGSNFSFSSSVSRERRKSRNTAGAFGNVQKLSKLMKFQSRLIYLSPREKPPPSFGFSLILLMSVYFGLVFSLVLASFSEMRNRLFTLSSFLYQGGKVAVAVAVVPLPLPRLLACSLNLWLNRFNYKTKVARIICSLNGSLLLI